MMTQTEIAKELGISKNYLSNILNGKRGCDILLKNKLLKYYPNLNFKLLNPRFIVKGKKDANNNVKNNNDWMFYDVFPELESVTYHISEKSLCEGWKEEALRHRKTLEELGFLNEE